MGVATFLVGLLPTYAAIGVAAGNLLAAGVLGIMSATLSDAAFESWGWRAVPAQRSADRRRPVDPDDHRRVPAVPGAGAGRHQGPGPDHLHRPAGPLRARLPVSLYVLGGLLITIASVWLAPETAQTDLHQEPAWT
jgi:hypothetical protein